VLLLPSEIIEGVFWIEPKFTIGGALFDPFTFLCEGAGGFRCIDSEQWLFNRAVVSDDELNTQLFAGSLGENVTDKAEVVIL